MSYLDLAGCRTTPRCEQERLGRRRVVCPSGGPPPARNSYRAIGVLLLLLLLVLLLSSKSVLTNLAKSDQLFSLAPCELVAIKKPKWPHAFLKGSGVDGQATRLGSNRVARAQSPGVKRLCRRRMKGG